jgi:hypothetical protein
MSIPPAAREHFGNAISKALPALAVHALNQLRDTAEEAERLQGTDEEPFAIESCCPHCCGPCDSLLILHNAGALDAAVRPFLIRSPGWSWWIGDPHTGHVDPNFLHKNWKFCDNTDTDGYPRHIR